MKTILVVDDEFALVAILTSLLEEEGFRVISAANGADALDVLAKEQVQLVLTDFMMPMVNGGELVRRLRRLPGYASTPVIMMSASPQSIAMAGPIDVAIFLRKPFDLPMLLDAIHELIGKPTLPH